MNKTEAKLFSKAVISSIDTRLLAISAELAEFLEPVSDKLINEEACNIINEIREIVNNNKSNPEYALTQIIEILDEYNLTE